MSAQVDYPIVGSYNNQRLTNIDAERTINMFEYLDPKGKKDRSLINTSGIVNTDTVFLDENGLVLTGVGFRAQYQFNSFQYAVVGKYVYRIDATGVAVLLNPTVFLQNSVGYVGIDANNAVNPQIIIVDGVKGYIIDTILSTFTQITDSNFPPNPIDVCFLDGFFIVGQGGSNLFFMSSLNQGLVWGSASNVFTTNNGALPNILIVGASTFTGGVSGTPNFQTGVSVFLTLGAGGSLAGSGLAVSTTYYVIRINSTEIKLASSLADALSTPPIPITLTGDVTPVVNLVSNGQLQQGQINSHPGNIVACRTLHRRVFFFSQNYIEVWFNAGVGTNLPIRRDNSSLMEVGTPAIGSIVTGFDKMFFLSQDRDGLGSVMEVIGTQAIPISNRALDFQLAQYASNPNFIVANISTGVTDARGVMIKENGIIFYRLNFTTANHTYVYNVTLSDPSSEEGKLWHEEENVYGNRHPAQTHAYYNGNNYYGSYSQPILYLVDNSFVTNDGQIIPRIRIGKAICPSGYQRTRIDRFHLDLVQGQQDQSQVSSDDIDLLSELGQPIDTELGLDLLVADAISDGLMVTNNNPIVYLSISKDGGQTYGYRQVGLMGKIGERTYRTVWRKLGTIPRGQAFVPKFECYAELPFVILGGAWVNEVMPE